MKRVQPNRANGITLSRGTSLMEVLIAIFIFSIGLIGIAKLQVVAKKANYDSVQRMTATLVANEILERMRANPYALNTYVNGGSITLGRGSITTAPVACTAPPCLPKDTAQYDLWALEQILDGVTEQVASSGSKAGGLVSPTACISSTSPGNAGVYTIAIAWRGKAALSNPSSTTCGQGLGLYGTGDVYRRVLVLETFIFDQL